MKPFSLCELIRTLHMHPIAVTKAFGEQVEGLAAWFMAHQGMRWNNEDPVTNHDLAGLSIKLRNNLVVHKLKPAVSKLVRDTTIAYEPRQRPVLLQKAGIVEVCDVKTQRFFHKVVTIGWYLDGATYTIITATYDGEIVIQKWAPQFDGTDLAENYKGSEVLYEDEPDVNTFQYGLDSQKFLLALSLIIEAEKTPVVVQSAGCVAYAQHDGKKMTEAKWHYRSLYVAEEPIRRVPAERTPSPEEIVREGLALETVKIRAHIRATQHYGPKNSLVKSIYIAAHEADRWVKQGAPVKITVR